MSAPMTAVDPGVLREAIRRIREVVTPERIILFGSAARGRMTPGSDLDLLVVVPPPVDRVRTAARIYRHMVGLGTPVDILVVTPADLVQHRENPGMILGTILEEGQVVDGS